MARRYWWRTESFKDTKRERDGVEIDDLEPTTVEKKDREECYQCGRDEVFDTDRSFSYLRLAHDHVRQPEMYLARSVGAAGLTGTYC